MIDRRRVTSWREREMKKTNIAQRKEEKEKGRKEHKGREREKGSSHANKYRKNKRYPDRSDTLDFESQGCSI
jgi:hypothetical protein